MGSSSIVSTIRKKVCFAYVCSKCGFPVVSVIQMTAEARKSYIFSLEDAKYLANWAAKEAMEIAIDEINDCRNRKGIIPTYLHMREGGADSRYVRLNADGTGSFDISPRGYAVCPNCFNTEPWMNADLDNKVAVEMAAKLADENFPTVYLEGAEALKWAESFATQKMAAIEEIRKDKSIVENARINYILEKSIVDDLKNRIENIPGYKSLRDVEKQIIELRMQKETIGVFNLRAKKENKATLKQLLGKQEELKELVDPIKRPLDIVLKEQENELEINQLLAYGCNPELIVKSLLTTSCYRFIANNPPDEQTTFVTNDSEVVHDYRNVTETREALTEESKPMFCHKCGKRLLSNSLFCSYCGSKIE